MKTLYLECNMGAAGDMLMAALSELVSEDMTERLRSLGIPGVLVTKETVSRCGINGTHISVTVNGVEEESHDVHHHEHHHEHHHAHPHEHSHTHHHTSLADITQIISNLTISEQVKADALAVYQLIAEAESHAHGKPVEQIHFHEVGTMDAVADILGVCLLMEQIQPEQVIVSPVHVGAGQVHCAHGILPVPAPATAYILRDVPIYGGTIKGELCTPTGAALLRHFATEFGSMPAMRTTAIGYGMGKKEFPAANCVRAFLGETEDTTEQILELKCNLDDMTGEQIGYATEVLLAAGALDVFTTPIGMKKNRPGVLLTVLGREADRELLVRELFRHTTTIGIRETVCNRYVLHRQEAERETAFGPVRCKAVSGYGVSREKPEFEDMARIAREQNLPLSEITVKTP